MKNAVLKIGSHSIGLNFPPFVIAEMSGNHNQSILKALDIVKAVADSGAHALKIQTYTPDTMTLNLRKEGFIVSDSHGPWNDKSLYELYEVAHTPWEWHKQIFDYARALGLIAFSTPFDESAVDFLEGLEVPCYKVASFEITDINLIRAIAKTGKPIIMSTGMATVIEIAEAVEAARMAGAKDLILLKCTSSYPATPENSNLKTIPHLRELFGCEVGLSDHTLGIGASIASVALGATVIERHFTLNRSEGGVDSDFSLEPSEMAELVFATEQARQSMGKVFYGPTKSEQGSVQFRRSLYVVENVLRGDVISKGNVKAIRPGYGMPIKYADLVYGKSFKVDIEIGTPLSWEMIQ